MSDTEKECPMCGELMRLKTSEVTASVPGSAEPKVMKSNEWVCTECDHFEEAEED